MLKLSVTRKIEKRKQFLSIPCLEEDWLAYIHHASFMKNTHVSNCFCFKNCIRFLRFSYASSASLFCSGRRWRQVVKLTRLLFYSCFYMTRSRDKNDLLYFSLLFS